MNTQEVVDHIAGKFGVSKSLARDILMEERSVIQSTLKKGQDVTYVGFGTFSVSDRKARVGRNPQTGATLKIPATKVPRFRPGKALKQAVSRRRS